MRQNPHVRICGGPGSATTLVYPTLQRGRVGVGVASFGQVLRDGCVRADKDGNGLVERHPKRLGLVERGRVSCVPAEVAQELLHFTWKRYRLA